jgi:hypothetical protein
MSYENKKKVYLSRFKKREKRKRKIRRKGLIFRPLILPTPLSPETMIFSSLLNVCRPWHHLGTGVAQTS